MWDKHGDEPLLVLNITHLEADSSHQRLKSLIKVPNCFIGELLDFFQLDNVLSLRLRLLEFLKYSLTNLIQCFRCSSLRNQHESHVPIQCMTPGGGFQLAFLDIVIHSLSGGLDRLSQEIVLLWVIGSISMKYW